MKPSLKVLIIAIVLFFISMSIGLLFFEKGGKREAEKITNSEYIQSDLIMPEVEEK